jgi:hypothetical protein
VVAKLDGVHRPRGLNLTGRQVGQLGELCGHQPPDELGVDVDLPVMQPRRLLGRQGAAVAQRKRSGGSSPKTRQELYEMAKRRDLPGRSKMGRDELARALGYK